MKQRSLIVTSCWAIAAALLAVAAAAQEPAKSAPAAVEGPRAVLVEPVVDLGDANYGTTRTHVFVVRNEGTEPLHIRDARSTCACAVVDYDQEIPPGGEGRVSVLYDGETPGGSASFSVDAVTNDPANPKLTFTVKANVRYFIDAQPGFVRYVVVQKFEADSTLANTLYSLDGKPMRITSVESPYKFIEASFREARPDEVAPDATNKQQWKVETRISPEAPIGPLKGYLVVHLDHPEQKMVKMPVHGFVRPMLAATPHVADWGAVTPNEQGARSSVMVKNYAEEEVKVTAAETSVAGISAEVQEAQVGRAYWVILKCGPEMPKGEFSGVVRIKTDSPKEPLIEVPLKGTIL